MEVISSFINRDYLAREIEAAGRLLADIAYRDLGIQEREMNEALPSILMIFKNIVENQTYEKWPKFSACHSQLSSIGLTSFLDGHEMLRDNPPLKGEEPVNEKHHIAFANRHPSD